MDSNSKTFELAQSIQLCGSGSDNVHQTKGMNTMKVNETHVHAVYEKIKVLHYFRFAAERLIIFLLISIHIYSARYVAIWHTFYSCTVINFSNV